MVDSRYVVPGALAFCYFIYMCVSLWRRERAAARLEQERQELEQSEREELQLKREIYKTLSKTLRMEQIMDALRFEVLPDVENQTSTSSCADSTDKKDLISSERTTPLEEDENMFEEEDDQDYDDVEALERPDEENQTANTSCENSSDDTEVDLQELQDEENQTTSGCDNSSDADPEVKAQERPVEQASCVKTSLTAKILSSDSDGDKPECVICLQSYKAGDVLCSSRTNKCHHIFHHECAIGWLQESSECPLCRVSLLETAELPV